MLERFRTALRRTETRYFPLEYELDLLDDGRHLVRVLVWWGDSRRQIRNIEQLWSYGFHQTIETDQ